MSNTATMTTLTIFESTEEAVQVAREQFAKSDLAAVSTPAHWDFVTVAHRFVDDMAARMGGHSEGWTITVPNVAHPANIAMATWNWLFEDLRSLLQES